MEKLETLEDFYQRKMNWLPDNLKQDMGHFNVFRMEDFNGPHREPVRYSRRDFYKISLIRGNNICHYADKSLEISGTSLMFFNPNVPYKFECHNPDNTGFFCIFKEAFFTEKLRGSINDFPMFAPGAKPVYFLNEQQDKEVSEVFEKMLTEINSDYVYKYDLIRNYVTETIHYALKMQPTETLYKHPDAKSRIATIFSELLERQFPIESPNQRFLFRSANDFAKELSVHVNHLNRAIKETTGKTTTEHIFERLVSEAKALLKHTSWNISEISYCLGFEEPAHFNNFFKKQVALTPSAYRAA
ncbi:Helix-turn-helix domain-containing protein [Filimonas lacunae]|uniref:Helix-turn-helix domain-containing protein n=1 Tax=Filimonas lacunae TaxID=477680 RepID=A0A173MLK0_9BACT|nr:helix-turn-helix transcriptional regulator [Filimonas lacunae]BAV08356.1 transcriptional regulator, AraC family [Filimonas lacunae]SIT33452.1 Helix-turn-helix domain-containing protein [Filimonas lacunae]